jgi:leucyl/phenylalanyl-tRNA--protein transferase
VDIVRITRNLTPEMAEAAYREGMFPMGDPDSPIITWHRPGRRAILPLDGFHVSHSLARTLRQARFSVTFDRAFDDVMRACADREETWITAGFRRVYGELQQAGKAHSVEVWVDGALGAGVYGVHLGAAFFAESMFHRARDMSKVALAHLVERLRAQGFLLLEVQYLTPHLVSLGAIEISGREYQRRLAEALAWTVRF